jgi:hypothetical protein
MTLFRKEGAMDGADEGKDEAESVVGGVVFAQAIDATEKAVTVRIVTFLEYIVDIFGVFGFDVLDFVSFLDP